ncbi:WD repeat domain phosphoinositide-interacting protein 4-like [Adelges cooleyi]|uniref:WD repeat domain phosphoinositide-interacting protein 4-like n=1 Tax=Adelges cooleyi TaxID=133065 RepID=UPI00217FEBC4|nr:WD repeat domain phosphoinositide-interacting protein 4-like [Adelges cooleyi]XP_050437316.1 WD repeat domain phosphoinositide-interacting protein 4-like [Adelges cooleyi]
MHKKGVINLRFNQDQGCFSCCTETGLRIYNVEPLVQKDKYEFGGLSLCEMLYRSNLFAIVAGGRYPKYSQNTVLIYDDLVKKFVMEIICPSAVKAVRMRRDKLVIASINQISVFTFPVPTKHILTMETRPNPMGLCEVSPLETSEKQVLVFPGHKIGSIQLLDVSNLETSSSSAPITLNAHQGEITCLAVNQQGTLVASASSKGTLIRIWDTVRKTKVAELRRGSDPATLYCINFSPDSEFLCCSSDKGTVHIFALKDSDLNRKSSLSTLSFFSSYVESQWALTNFTVPPEMACICAFLTSNTVIAACLDGTFHKYTFLKDGSCRRKAYNIFLDDCTDEDI